MTFTLLALERSTGLLGAATASYSLAVGGAAIAIAPDCGAVLSQAYTNRALRRGALEGLRAGMDASDAVEAAIATEREPQYRQLAVMDLRGDSGAYTGPACTPWAGVVRGDGALAAGNLLTSAGVLDAMLGGYVASPSPLGDSWSDDVPPPPGIVVGPVGERVLEAFAVRLLTALRRGAEAGGDRRGLLSAALLVGPVAAGTGWPPDLALDLRSDHSSDPIGDLGRMLAMRFAEPTSTAR